MLNLNALEFSPARGRQSIEKRPIHFKAECQSIHGQCTPASAPKAREHSKDVEENFMIHGCTRNTTTSVTQQTCRVKCRFNVVKVPLTLNSRYEKFSRRPASGETVWCGTLRRKLMFSQDLFSERSSRPHWTVMMCFCKLPLHLARACAFNCPQSLTMEVGSIPFST